MPARADRTETRGTLMIEGPMLALALAGLHIALQVLFVGRALLRPYREPASRLAWVVVIIVAPVVGMLAYVLFGETNIGRRRIARLREALAQLPTPDERRGTAASPHAGDPGRYAPLFRVGSSISGFRRSAATAASCSPIPTRPSTRWSRTSMPPRITSTCCSTSGCPTTTA